MLTNLLTEIGKLDFRPIKIEEQYIMTSEKYKSFKKLIDACHGWDIKIKGEDDTYDWDKDKDLFYGLYMGGDGLISFQDDVCIIPKQGFLNFCENFGMRLTNISQVTNANDLEELKINQYFLKKIIASIERNK